MGEHGVIHDFDESLDLSNRRAQELWVLDMYRAAYPNVETLAYVRKDGWAQRGGVDRVVTLSSGKTITHDEKFREKVWNDFCLEYFSDLRQKTRGWVAKDLACDVIAYAFVPIKTAYFLPFQTLREAWRRNHESWVSEYPKIDAENKTWITRSVAVPIPVVLDALGDAVRIKW